jgi:hypothetical protein
VRLFPLVLVVCAASAPLAGQAPVPAGAPPNTLRVEVGVFGMQPDGSVGGYAVETAEVVDEQFVSAILSDECRRGAGQGFLPNVPAWGKDAWEIRGRVISLTPDQATIQLDWKRVRAAGAAVQQPTESRRLVLPLGQLLTLEAIPGTSAPCNSVFGARYMPAFSGRLASAGGRAGLSGAGGGVVSSVPSFDAELWLVRGVPGKADTVVPTNVRVLGGVANFRFGSIQVQVPGGVVDVHVEGQLRILPGTGPQPVLIYKATRAAAFTPSARPARDRATPDPEGVAMVTRPLPGPDDVLEFEMPPLEVRGAPSVPDTFAVRLRLRPLKGGGG